MVDDLLGELRVFVAEYEYEFKDTGFHKEVLSLIDDIMSEYLLEVKHNHEALNFDKFMSTHKN